MPTAAAALEREGSFYHYPPWYLWKWHSALSRVFCVLGGKTDGKFFREGSLLGSRPLMAMNPRFRPLCNGVLIG